MFIFALALGIPAYVISRFDRLGAAIPLAVATSWMAIYFGGRLLTTIHPADHPAYLDSAWLRTGWIGGLLYALLLLSIRLIIRHLRTRRAKV